MKRNLLKRGLALITCAAVCMTSLPNLAFAAETTTGTEFESQAEAQAETPGRKEVPEETKNQSESPEETKNQPESPAETQTRTESESPEETPAQTGGETSNETRNLDETNMSTVVDDESEHGMETEPKEIKMADARVRLAWSDAEDIADRRGDERPADFLTVYANGVAMPVQPEIVRESAWPEEAYGIQTDTYIIKNLPVTEADGVTVVSYTVRETAPKGYTSFSDRAFKDSDVDGQARMMAEIAAPEQEVALKLKEDESSYEAEKTFGNYLPAYWVEGSILWENSGDNGQRPDMESYFKNQFTILRNIDSANYTAFKIHYTQDETDPNRWNYKIEGLFTTAADGSSVSYQIQPENVEGYAVHMENPKVAGDRTDLEAVYETEEKKMALFSLRSAEEEIIPVPKEYAEQTLPILWIDNDLSKRPEVTVTAEFSIDGTTYEYNAENARQYLGLSKEEFNSHSIQKKENTGTYDVYMLNAPGVVTQDDGSGNPSDKQVTWILKHSLSADKAENYIMPTETVDMGGYTGVYVYREKSSVSFILDIKNGASEEEISAFADEISLYKQIGSQAMEQVENISEGSASAPVIVKNADNTYTVTFDRLPRFTDEKVEIIYSLQSADRVTGDAMGDDYYKTSYNNSASSNFSNNQSECHDGGTLELTLKGMTVYGAEKIWLDDGTEERPAGTWSLWRYSEKEGTTYKEAAQVTDGEGRNCTLDLVPSENIKKYTFENLEKYDPEGYLYVYLAREAMDGGSYEQVHLDDYTVDKITGQVTKITENQRSDGGDHSIYDGDILANRITGQTNVEWRKVWKAGNYQNELSDVKVTLQLQQKPETANALQRAGGEWENVPEATQVIDNFIAENLIQSGSVSVSKYDELGLPQQYQWIESSITEGDTPVEIDTNGHFQLSHNRNPENMSPNGHDEEYYVSDVKTESVEDPENPGKQINRTVITNRLEGTTTYTVDKLWAQIDDAGNVQKDDQGNVIYGKAAPDGAKIEIRLYQDNQLYKAEGTDENAKLILDSSSNFYHEYKLPKYDESGIKYSYDAKESACTPAWDVHTDYNVNIQKDDGTKVHYDMQMKNTPVGVGKSIWLFKDWLDDGDESHRQNVRVALYRKAQTADGETADHYFGTYTLTASHNWRLEVGVTEYTDADKTDVKYLDLTLDQYYIREVAIGDTAQFAYDFYHSGAGFEPSKGGAPELKSTIDRGTTSLNNEELIYEAYYDMDAANNTLTVVNRRVGTVNVSVTKNWLDGNNENNERPENVTLALKAVAEDGYSDGSIAIDETKGRVTVKDAVGGSGVYDVENSDGMKAGAVQPLSAEDGKTYEFYNLPKYDALGRVLHYTVEERGLAAPYSGRLTTEAYDATFVRDNQSMKLINQRTGTKTPEFHKKWKDWYNYETGRRPDIYFTLYQAKRDADGNYVVEEVKPYPGRTWTYTSGMEWVCRFDSSLPKYDENGYEIMYYVTEGSQVNRAAFDYLPEEFYTDASATEKSDCYAVRDGEGYKTSETAGTDGFQILPESGCLVNRIQNQITVSGQKVWKNVPSGFPTADFPNLTMKLYRTLTPTVTGVDTLTFEEALNRMTGRSAGDADGVTTDPVAWTKALNRIGKTNNFTFEMTVEGDNDLDPKPEKLLEKYDEEGRLYDYELIEEVDGSADLEDTTYEKLPGQVNDFIVTNTYEITDEKNTGHLQAVKNWSGITDTEKYSYPGIQFKLYRQYVSNDKEQNTETVISGTDSILVTKAELVDTKKLDSGKDASGTVTFDTSKLRIHAPNGTKYYYYIEETLLHGYSYDATENNTVPQKSPVFLLEAGKTAESPQKISFENTYQPDKEKVILTGTKVWDDYSNSLGIRPTGETFKNQIKVLRYADAQNLAGGGQAIAEEEILVQSRDANAPNYIEWTETDTATWTYTIHNLEKYAPNTMPWKYVVKESAVSGYKASPADTDPANVNGGRVDSKDGTLTDNEDIALPDLITMPPMTNSSRKSAAIQKTWTDADAYGIRPATVIVELYAKIGNDGTWEKASEAMSGASLVDTDIGKRVLSAANDWKTTYENLPAYINKDNKVQPVYYQIVEINIGGKLTAEPGGQITGGYTLDPVTVTDAGYTFENEKIPYKVSSTATCTKDGDSEQQFGKTDRTAVKNEVYGDGNVNLKITKTWDDSQDAYDTRSVTDDSRKTWKADFALYRKAGTDGQWEQVKNRDSRPVVLRVQAENKHTAEADMAAMSFGPFPKYDSSLNLFTYAAVEITPYGYVKTETLSGGGPSGNVVPDMANVSVIVGSPTTEADTAFDFAASAVNDLNPTTSVAAKKAWKKADGTAFTPAAGTTVSFELLKNGASFETPVTKAVAFDGKQSENTVTFTGLPRYTYGSDGTAIPITYSIQEVTVNDNGTTVPTVADGFWKTIGEMTGTGTVTDGNYSLSGTITNTQTEFALDKQDTEGASITNQTTVFGIYKGGNKVATWTREKTPDGYTEAVTPETGSTVEAVPAAAGSARIKGLPLGTYTLKEERVPWGYEKAADITFTLGMSDGKLALTSTTSGAVSESVDNNTLKLVMKDEPIRLTLKKVAAGGTGSIDSTDNYAEFTVTGTFADGSTEKTGITSATIGSLDKLWLATTGTTEGTDQFTYTFTETKAPAGYELAPFFKMTIGENGTIKTITVDSGTNPAFGINTAELKVADEPIKIQVKKTDESGSNLTGAEFRLDDYGTAENTTGTPMQSVTFECFNGEFSTVTDKTNGNNKITVTQNHRYVLTETKAPRGYILPQDADGTASLRQEFTVGTDGTITAVGTPDSRVTVDRSNARITVKNKKIQLTLRKEDIESSSTKLADAEFALYKGEAVAGSPEIPSIETSNGSDGGTLGEAVFPSNGSPAWLEATYDTENPVYYTLKEIKAPSGYERIAEPLTFYITSAGKVVFKTPEAEAVKTQYAVDNEGASVTLTAKDRKTEFILAKKKQDVDAPAEPMDGVTLDIYEQNEDGSRGTDKVLAWEALPDRVIIWKASSWSKYDALDTTLTDGTIKGLPAGNYILAEDDSTRDEYLKIEDTPFTVNTDGTVSGRSTTSTNGSSYVTFDAGKLSITATDMKIRGDVSFTKYLGTGADQKALAGVKFDLYLGSAADGTGEKIAENLVTDANGILTIKNQADTVVFNGGPGYDSGKKVNIGLPAGTYYLQEAGATADSVLDTSKRVGFTVARDETKKAEQPQAVPGDLENEIFSAAVTFQKVDGSDGRPVDKAVFKLKYTPEAPAGNAVAYEGGSAHTYESDSSGKITMSGLQKGSYELYEVSAAGYQMTGNAVDGKFVCKFNIVEADHGKTLKLDETSGFEVISGKAAAHTESAEYQVQNTRIMGSVAIKKQSDDREPLALNGAQFKLTKVKEADGTAIENAAPHIFTFESGKNYKVDGDGFSVDAAAASVDGILKISGLDWGSYTLTETKAPDGYKLEDKTVDFEIGRYALDLTAESDGRKVTNVRTAITLKKKDAASDTIFLPGAEFTIEPLTDADAFAGEWKDSRSQTIAVDAYGTLGGAYVLEGKLIGGNSYTLTETKAPLGYELPTGDAAVTTFAVKEDGTIENTDNATDIIVSDEQIKLNLTKQDMGDAGIAGAVLDGTTFTISGTFKADNGVDIIEKTGDAAVNVTAAGGKLDLTSLNGKWLATTGDAEGTDRFTYTLTETVAPKGYELPADPDHTFTVDTSGNITMTNVGAFSGKDENMTVKDAKIEVDIQKTDEKGGVIGDEKRGYAEFSVTGIFAGETAETTISGSTAKTNNISDLQTKLSGRLVAGNSYTLTETKAPDGYILPDPALTAVFTVDANGEIRMKPGEDAGGKATADNNGANGMAVISVKDSPIALSLTKSDIADGIAIAGRGDAAFEVTPTAATDTFADGSKTAVTVTTAENGMDALTGKLRPNVSYTMKETAAPKGYQLAAPFTFKVDAQGRAALEGTPDQAAAAGTALTVKDRKIEVSLRKVSSQDDRADAMDSTKLPGAVFEVTPESGSAFAVEVTDSKITLNDSNENGLSGMLIAGHTYRVHEVTAPAGYELAQDFTFTVDENGMAAVTNPGTADSAGVISGDGDSVVVRVKDEPIELAVVKKDKADTSKALAGAEFKLVPVDGHTFADGSTKEKILKTEADGKAVIPSASLKQEADYVLTETKAPNGYVLAAPAPGVNLHVQTDGTVTLTEVKDQRDYSIEGTGTAVITVTDRMTKLTLDKADNETQERLAGAVLEIYLKGDFDAAKGKPMDGAVAKASWTSTTAAAGEITGLIAGAEYVLYEAAAPSGYDSFKPVSFTLETDNRITLADTGRTDITLTQDKAGAEETGNWTIKMTDTRIRGHVALTKAVKDGKAGSVADVKFDLYYQTGSTPDVHRDKKVAENLTTDGNGVWVSTDNTADSFKDPSDQDAEVPFSKGLPTGDYYFVETKATADTALDSTTKHTFSIGDSDTQAHGKVVPIRVENTAFSAKVTLQKLDEKSGTGINGVKFKLTYVPEHQSRPIELEKATNDTGAVVFDGLPKGSYTLTETKADGYDIAGLHDTAHRAFTAVFTIDEDDNGREIRITDTAGEDSANPKVTKTQGEWNDKGITNPRLLGSVTIHKVDGEDTSKALEGVEFKLMKKKDDGGFIDWLKNLFTGSKYAYVDVPTENLSGVDLDTKGTLTIENLDWGTYKLVETRAKDGYSTTDRANSQILATAEFTIDRTSAKVIELKADGHDFYNYRTLLTIQKNGVNGVTGLSGAEFTLSGGKWVDSAGVTVDTPMTVMTNEDGQIILQGALIGGETYTLHDTTAPEGYERITTDFVFTMNTDGSIAAVSGHVASGEGYVLTDSQLFTNTVTAVDTPVELKLVKTGLDGKTVLPGAEFKVTPKDGSRFADGSDSITLTDENMADGLDARLIAGHTYILEEVTAPEGYEKNDPIEFTVDSDGEVTVT
ncbi:SpaA isopeptide-forming pilin-related protein, partial [Frisingicoccus sp.]|uniref:SpaA isopeptide-forming pilin-related protein n=1 Tax=Frisingicoccus sp. TaxID=1918627 RepID=UPI002E79810E